MNIAQKEIKTKCQNNKDCVVEVHQSGFLSLLPVLEAPLEPSVWNLQQLDCVHCFPHIQLFSLSGSPQFKVEWLASEAGHSAYT
jgi:hypothetical protein